MERSGVGRASIITAIETTRLTIIVNIVKMKLRSIAPKSKDPNSIVVLRMSYLTPCSQELLDFKRELQQNIDIE
jgi:hypothetical protein